MAGHGQGSHGQEKKIWKMKTFSGQGKVREFHFHLGKFRKKYKKAGNKTFSKTLIVNRFLKIIFYFKFQAVYAEKNFFSSFLGLRFFFKD